jgi:hypothetical protein
MGMRWPKIISNTELWEAAGETLIILQIIMRKWRWIGHTLRKGEKKKKKQALDWNRQEARCRGRTKKIWKKTVSEEAENESKRGVRLKADSHITCCSHAAPMPFPCYALPLRV